MSAERNSTGRSISPWWGLLLLPLPMVVGWFVADLPTHSKPAPNATASFTDEPIPGPPAGIHMPALPGAPSGVGSAASADLEWVSMNDALETSHASGRPILIDFNAEWCGPCQQLKRSVFDDSDISRRLGAAVVGVSVVDRQREMGENPPDIADLQQRFQLRCFPTLVVMSPATGRFEKLEGYGGPELTEKWILDAARKVR